MAKKKQELSGEEALGQALVPESEQPYAVPGNWVWTRLSSLVIPMKDKFDDFNSPDERKYVGLEHMQNGIGVVGFESSTSVRSLKNIFSQGDILYGKLRPYLNKHGIASFDGICSTDILVFKQSSTGEKEYVNFYMDTDHLIEYAVSNSKGINLPRVSEDVLLNAPCPLPPLPEQQRIVERIESLFAKLDQAKSLVQEALDSFENRKAAILHKAFTGELTKQWRRNNLNTQSAEILLKEIKLGKLGLIEYKNSANYSFEQSHYDLPENWVLTTLGALVTKIEAGKNFSCPEIPVSKGNVGLVKISAVTWGKFDSAETKTVTDETKINNKYFIRKGDFLISRANTLELVGMSVVVEDIEHDIMISDKVWRVIFCRGLEKYVNYYLKSTDGRKEIETRATGNQLSMRNISQDSFRKIQIPLPPLEELNILTSALDDLFAKEQSAKELYDVIDNIDRMKKAILARAFRGELGTNDPSEESALGLLKEALAH